MTKSEAIAVLVDLATKRKPHGRHTVKQAVAVLEPAAPVAKQKKGAGNVKSA